MSTHPVPIPHTANDIVIQMSRLARDLDDIVRVLGDVDRDAVEKRNAYEDAYNRAFLRELGSGSVDHRKALAAVATRELHDAAEVADALVRHLRRKLRATETRIEVGRSMNAALRSELSLINQGVNGE